MRSPHPYITPPTPFALPVARTHHLCHYAQDPARRCNLRGNGSGARPDNSDTRKKISCVGQRVTHHIEKPRQKRRDNSDTPISLARYASYASRIAQTRPHDRETYFPCVTVVTVEKSIDIKALRDTQPDTPRFVSRVGWPENALFQCVIRHTCEKGGF